MDRRTGYRYRPRRARMFHFDKHLASRNMRIGEDVRSGVDRAERNASVKRVCDLCLGADARPSLDEVDRLLGVGQPIIVGRKSWIAGQIGPAHDADEFLPEGVT